MKKLIAALAVLTIAAVAQAELLASWSVGGVANGTESDGYKYQENQLFGVKDMEALSGSISTSTKNDVRVSGNSGVKFDYNATEDLQAVTISGTYHVTGSGPAKTDWYVGEKLVASVTRDNDGYSPFESTLGLISAGSGTIKLQADLNGGKATATSTTAISGNIDLTGVEINGVKATSVPEPATMSLLGLGALAMVLRRKLRK